MNLGNQVKQVVEKNEAFRPVQLVSSVSHPGKGFPRQDLWTSGDQAAADGASVGNETVKVVPRFSTLVREICP